MSKKKHFELDQPLQHPDHHRPVSRRDFLGQGFRAGMATVLGGSVFSMFANPAAAQQDSDLSDTLKALRASCGINAGGAGKIPFICFDLAGGANIAGSNVLVGKQGGQEDFLSTAGYSKQGLPGDMIPSLTDAAGNSFINRDLGLAFHSDSQMLRGILERVGFGNRTNINGAVIPARSENDTGNNPHNPMYGINRVGANGSLLALIGSQTSESGGNSMAPADLINPKVRPTKIDRPSDATGLVDVGDLVGLLSKSDTVAVMESMYRLSKAKMGNVTGDADIRKLVECGYLKSADLADRFGDPATLDPTQDTDIVGPTGIFSKAELDRDREFQKTASTMKLVIEGYAGAGTITMGGYDYHTGDRATGEMRDLRAGRCIGACLEYAARKQQPLMLYVFSDGSVFSNGMIDDSPEGRGKGVWTGDNQQTAASFFLVYNPFGRPELLGGTADEQARHQQLGYMRPSGDVETAGSPAANNVNQLVQTVVLNYLALHGEQGQFDSHFPNHGLGNASLRDELMAFAPIR